MQDLTIDDLELLGLRARELRPQVGTVAGRLLRFIAIERVGASISAAIVNLNPLKPQHLDDRLAIERDPPQERR